jgi:hypothetical protein
MKIRLLMGLGSRHHSAPIFAQRLFKQAAKDERGTPAPGSTLLNQLSALFNRGEGCH